MNKYDGYFYENEGVSRNVIKMDDEYYTKLITNYLKENDRLVYDFLKQEFQEINLNVMLVMLNTFSKKTKLYFKENIINKLNKKFLLHYLYEYFG